eukprot:GHVO01035767.1.p1 GENE.GHVO01035767.1~~GHVO01035767.1.p1  ORF type:complete len:139 (-),score=18.27 GHVO01035767.1:166-582(-)
MGRPLDQGHRRGKFVNVDSFKSTLDLSWNWTDQKLDAKPAANMHVNPAGHYDPKPAEKVIDKKPTPPVEESPSSVARRMAENSQPNEAFEFRPSRKQFQKNEVPERRRCKGRVLGHYTDSRCSTLEFSEAGLRPHTPN